MFTPNKYFMNCISMFMFLYDCIYVISGTIFRPPIIAIHAIHRAQLQFHSTTVLIL